jgi:hypothetical protein
MEFIPQFIPLTPELEARLDAEERARIDEYYAFIAGETLELSVVANSALTPVVTYEER